MASGWSLHLACVTVNSVVVMGVSEHLVSDAEEALGWLGLGNTARITAATKMNQRSSRSHALFTIHISKLYIISVFHQNL